jgi:type III secretion system export apparatus protein
MNELIYAGNQALYLVLILSAVPVAVATLVGLLIGMLQTVTQLQEQTLPFGLKLLSVTSSLFFLSGWYGQTLMNFAQELMSIAFAGQ